jgi:formylglycine-generating enzyme required for sulfatase activity
LFLAALNQQDPGKGYRLPTEAEWEYAARAGTTGDYNVPGQAVTALGWIATNSQGKTRLVAQKLPNAWGLYDLHGNVGEWVQDWYSANYYSVSPSQNPPGPANGSGRVLRSGSWSDFANNARSAGRGNFSPSNLSGSFGFRLARTP